MPETTNYMILGYAVVVILMGALIAYLVIKARNLRAELEMLEAMEQEGTTANPSTQANPTAQQNIVSR